MSFERALRGETYTTRVSSGSGPFCASRNSSSIAWRKAASVFPEPVGAAISVSRPERIASQPRTWGTVGAPNRSANQLATAG